VYIKMTENNLAKLVELKEDQNEVKNEYPLSIYESEERESDLNLIRNRREYHQRMMRKHRR